MTVVGPFVAAVFYTDDVFDKIKWQVNQVPCLLCDNDPRVWQQNSGQWNWICNNSQIPA